MNKKQKLTALALALSLSTSGAYAAASGKPTSQFGFKGWPYRQSSICITPQPQASCTPVPTAQPTPVPTAQVTPIPTVQVTPVPTAAPTTQPTATPNATKAPQATQKPQATMAPPGNDDDYTTPSMSAQEEIALNLLNQDRIANGLPALKADPALCDIARLKSQDMHENGYFAHTSPTYGTPSDMLRSFGYSFVSVAENIAHHANVHKAQAAFMSSDGHRRNALGSQWSKVGIGVWTDSQGYVYVTQLFVR